MADKVETIIGGPASATEGLPRSIADVLLTDEQKDELVEIGRTIINMNPLYATAVFAMVVSTYRMHYDEATVRRHMDIAMKAVRVNGVGV